MFISELKNLKFCPKKRDFQAGIALKDWGFRD